MTNARPSFIVGLAVCLAACDANPAPRSDTQIEPATVPEPVETDATQRVPLQDMVGGEVTGELVVTPTPDSVVFRIDLVGAARETAYGVRIQPGPCDNTGDVIVVLEGVRTGALGNGSAQRALGANARDVMDGRHVVAIYAMTAEPDRHRPLACAPIPAIQ